MKNILVVVATAAAIFSAAARAADMPVKAPAQVVSYNWSGLYVGGNIGGMWRDMSSYFPLSVGLTQNFSHNDSHIIGGVHIGAQQQWAAWVLGIEAAWSSPFDSAWTTGSPNAGCPNPFYTCQAKLTDIWTVGGRLGWTPAETWLVYATGGYAHGKVSERNWLTGTGGPIASASATHGGWYAGAGIDWAVWRNPGWDVILGLEYQHIDLGTVRVTDPSNTPIDYRATAEVVRARLTWKGNFWR